VKPCRAACPVICVGNLTAGGTGKTPLSLAIADMLVARGERPVFLTRGYKGRISGPVWVDLESHTARDVGDEPLLLARKAPVMVAQDRAAGARAIEASDVSCSVIVMDDGLQNPSLEKDLVLAVVDGTRGIGNGEVIPAGPLRAPLDFQLSLVDAIVVNGAEGAAGSAAEELIYERLRRNFPGPVLSAAVAPVGDATWLRTERLLAYAGIGNPNRFFHTVRSLGGDVVDTAVFADHYGFCEEDARHLLERARSLKATLLTTEKDHARLTGARGALADLRNASRVLAIRLIFEEADRNRLAALIHTTMTKSGASQA
jgi:tetraacyldisaccharide 4'-kinase